MDTSATRETLSKIETKCGGHSDSDVRVAWKDVKERMEMLRKSATATHSSTKDDPSTIALRKRRAKQAIDRLRKHADQSIYLDLDALEDEIDAVKVSKLT